MSGRGMSGQGDSASKGAGPRRGQRIGEYVLEEEIGRGGFGVVFRARHHALPGRVVAVKLAQGEERARMLRHEGMLQDIVRHPGAVEVLGLDADHDPPYLVTEYVDGEPLAARLGREKRLDQAEAVRLGCAVLEPLACAHERGIVHRDVTPANVLLARDGRVKLADFGLGRARDEERERLAVSGSLQSQGGEALVGTLPYMAPEQKSPGRAIDRRADVYAFGIILFEMLTGARPEGGEIPSDLVPGLDPRLDDVFRRCYCRLEKRYPDAGAVLADLRPIGRHIERVARSGGAAVAVAAGGPAPLATLERADEGCRGAEEVLLGPGPIELGTGAGAAVRIPVPWVSWSHAEVRYEAGAWSVRDLGSVAGTFLLPAVVPPGKRPIDLAERVGREPLRLGEGVTLCLGDPRGPKSVRFRFHDGRPADGEGVAGARRAARGGGAMLGKGLGLAGMLMLAAGTFWMLRTGNATVGLAALGLGLGILLLSWFLRPRPRRPAAPARAPWDLGRPAVSMAPASLPVVTGRPAGVIIRGVALLFDIGLMALIMRFMADGSPAGALTIWLLYDGLTTAAIGGTLGKWLCGLTVVDIRGRRVGPVRSAARALAKLLSTVPLGLGFALAGLSGSRAALHDLLVDTRVVQSEGLFDA